MITNKTVFFVSRNFVINSGYFYVDTLMEYKLYIKRIVTVFFHHQLLQFLLEFYDSCYFKKDNQLNLQQAFLFSTMAWISIAFFGSIPFLLSNLDLNF